MKKDNQTLHYLKLLHNFNPILQPEIRKAVDDAIKILENLPEENEPLQIKVGDMFKIKHKGKHIFMVASSTMPHKDLDIYYVRLELIDIKTGEVYDETIVFHPGTDNDSGDKNDIPNEFLKQLINANLFSIGTGIKITSEYITRVESVMYKFEGGEYVKK